jgi:hypothetical protein
MKQSRVKIALVLAGSVAASLLAATGARADVNVDIYRDHTTTGDGTPYGSLWAIFTAPQVSFGTDTGFMWFPTELGAFGADITGTFTAQQTGNYLFGLASDDGSRLFLNNDLGTPVVDHGGASPSLDVLNALAPISLTAGQSIPLEIRFFEDFGGHSGVDLYVKGPGDDGSRLVSAQELRSASTTPEPSSLALLATGGLPLLGFLRRRRRG